MPGPGQVTPRESVLVYLGALDPVPCEAGPHDMSLTSAGAVIDGSCACMRDPPEDTPDTELR